MRPSIRADGNEEDAIKIANLLKKLFPPNIKKDAAKKQIEKRFNIIIYSIMTKELSIQGIAKTLGVHRSTVYNVIEQWNRHGDQSLLEGYRTGRPSKTPNEKRRLLLFIKREVEKNKNQRGKTTLESLKKAIQKQFGVDYHIGHIGKLRREAMRPHQKPVERKKWVRYDRPHFS